GYVLRRIIRRATRHIWKLGALHSDGLFWQMLSPLIDMMGEAYPELFAKRNLIEQALKAEEAAFSSTLDAGMTRLETMLKDCKGILGGGQLFLLHDTYGCPPDLIIDVLRERSLEPANNAMHQYEDLMDQQRERARGASKFAGSVGLPAELVASLHATEFKGYENLEVDGCKIIAIIKEGQPVQSLLVGEKGSFILDKTPFYAESGGQIGDSGVLCSSAGQQFLVADTQKLSSNLFGHIGEAISGNFSVGDKLSARVDSKRRAATVINHSATHLLHTALRKVLGEHVSQKGSLVNTERTRFDFSHFQAISAEQINEIEDLVNIGIRANAEAEVHHMGMQEAIDFGAMALFGEKYGERVRVLKMGEFSTELCGGTHVHRTGDIGLFKIISEAGIAAGVRRIEAVTGANALASYKHSEDMLSKAAALVNGRSQNILEKINQLLENQKKLEQELDTFKSKAANNISQDLARKTENVAGIAVVHARLEGLDGKALNELLDNLKLQLPNSIVVIASAQEGKVALVVGVQGSAQSKIKAGEVLSHIAAQIGGKGGGRAEFARGGGEDGPALTQALGQLNTWLAGKIS
ncbi:MAG TPA: alanine--tRNA ligase, partial [Arenimonas sp.]|nr:alanine--tRNA ligase [Arenimonas sp.]